VRDRHTEIQRYRDTEKVRKRIGENVRSGEIKSLERKQEKVDRQNAIHITTKRKGLT